MNDRLIEEIVAELKPRLTGRPWGKVFQLSRAAIAVDFRTGDGRYLFISVEPGQPRLYMIARTVRELEKSSNAPSQFALVLRKSLGGAMLRSLTKDDGERIVRFTFDVPDATGEEHVATLVAQLTGRTANLFLLDERGRVRDSMRPSRGEGQEVGDVYTAPAARGNDTPAAGNVNATPRKPETTTRKELSIERAGFASLSDALDHHYAGLERKRIFDSRAAAATSRLVREISKLRKLRDNLTRDLAAHGDAEAHRRAGELLLANIGTAERSGSTVRLTDFYADGTPSVELEIDEQRSLQEEAAHRFARYGKAKRAAQEISERLKTSEAETAALEERRAGLEAVIAARDEDALAALVDDESGAVKSRTPPRTKRSKKESEHGLRGARRYRSSDGYEILVGRGPRENDQLTFRVARSYDTWLHAADYPGSHVVVRSRSRDEQVPHRAVVEAAQLAAHFSKAAKDAKVAVNYTQRKFVSKPKGATPGLVYLSSFRTLLVEPREDLERI
jgi:predicted ribosome quality control (RQC) complex YloA/Tae2 family protein